MSQQISNKEAVHERPVIARRRKSVESFRSDKAIQAIQRQIGREGFNLDVSGVITQTQQPALTYTRLST
jgi:hypothetical protein